MDDDLYLPLTGAAGDGTNIPGATGSPGGTATSVGSTDSIILQPSSFMRDGLHKHEFATFKFEVGPPAKTEPIRENQLTGVVDAALFLFAVYLAAIGLVGYARRVLAVLVARLRLRAA
jgi:hypothetical protein